MRTTDLTLRDDIRFLGRLLGDTLREQEGEKTFALVEEIRQLSVAFRRHADAKAGQRLNRLLNRMLRARGHAERGRTGLLEPAFGRRSAGSAASHA